MMLKWKHMRIAVLLLSLLYVFVFTTVTHADEEKHPSMITINGGQSIGDGSYINHNDYGYPFIAEVVLEEKTIPLESCVLGVYSWDCDEDATSYWNTSEYDMVYVNGTCVGVLTGVDNSWKTSYFNVPIDLLKIGNNTITIYVGHRDHATGEIVQNTDDWLLEVKWLSLQIDGGQSEDAPEHFSLALTSASRTESGIQCSAQVEIESDKQRSYVVEYSLVDQTGVGPTNGQIVAGDDDYVSGTSIVSNGYFLLPSNSAMGNYQIQATLRDPSTNEVLAYTSKTFDLGVELNGSCEHEAAGARTFVKTEYSRLSRNDENYSVQHQMLDVFSVTCSKCGETNNVFENLRYEAHKLPVCVCGFVAEGHNSIYSAEFSALQNGCVGESFVVTVVTDDFITRLEATNNVNYPMQDDWNRRDNGDGTVTWSRVYTANLESQNQYWNVTAYCNSSNAGTKTTNSLDIKEQGSVTFKDAWDSITKKGDYTLMVMDAETGKPVTGASVVLMGQGGTTDANGKVVFSLDKLSSSGNLYIKANDYYEHSESKYSLGIGNSVDVIQLYSANTAKVVPLTCNSDNIATGMAQLNVKAHLEAEIKVDGLVGENDKIVSYTLLQNGNELETSTDGKFTVANSEFTEAAELSVKMQYKTAAGKINSVEAPLNIVVVSQGIGDWLNLDGLPILEKLDFAINGLPDVLGDYQFNFNKTLQTPSWKQGKTELTSGGFQDCSIDNYQITIGLGINIDKDFLKLNEGLRKWHKDHNHNLKDDAITFNPALIASFSFNKDGIYETVASIGVNASASIGKDHTIPGVLWGIPLNVKWKLSGSVGAFCSDLGYNLINKAWVTPNAELNFVGSLYGAAGAGCKFANAGIYGKVTLNADGTISISSPVKASATGQVSGELGLEAELELGLLSWNGSLKLIELKSDKFVLGQQIYIPVHVAEEEDKEDYAARLRNAPRLASGLTTSDIYYTDHKDAVTLITEQQPYQILETNIDTMSDVQIAAVGDCLVMAYVVNDSQNEARYGHIVYRVWDGAAWSEAKALTDAVLPQGDFDLKSDGEKLCIAYVQMKRSVELTDADMAGIDDLSDLAAIAEKVLAPCEIVVASFDNATKNFQVIDVLTDDDAWDSAPVLAVIDGVPHVAWVKDTSNTALGLSNNNSLYYACQQADGQWQMNEVAAQLPMVAQLDLGVLDGQVSIAVVCDIDNNQETMDDRKLNLYGVNGEVAEIAAGQVSQPLFGQARQADGLIWYQDGNIMYTTGKNAAAQVILDESFVAPADYQLVTDNDRSYLLYTLYDGLEGTRCVMGIDLNNEQAYPVPMTNLPGYVDHFGAVAVSDGLTFALIRTDAFFDAEAFYTVSELCVTNYQYQKALELLALDWSTLDFIPGNEAMIQAYVRNLGSEEVTQLQVNWNGAAEGEAIVNTHIASGETKEITFACVIPEVLSDEINITVSLPGVEGSATAAGVVSLEFVDFYVDARQVVLAGKHYLLYTVQNIGSIQGECTMNVRNTDEHGEILFTKSITLDAQTVENDLIDLNETLAGYECKVLYIELVGMTDDTIELNNNHYVTFYAAE